MFVVKLGMVKTIAFLKELEPVLWQIISNFCILPVSIAAAFSLLIPQHSEKTENLVVRKGKYTAGSQISVWSCWKVR